VHGLNALVRGHLDDPLVRKLVPLAYIFNSLALFALLSFLE
jgi:hypothetical protein